MSRFCFSCGGDADELEHWRRCDGQQGQIEAEETEEAENTDADEVVITSPRETSIQAFYSALDAGIIETRRAQVWAALQSLGISTANEVFEHLKEERHLGLRYDSNTRARFTELRDLGLIREVGQRPCRVTGQVCITWAVVPSSEYVGVASVCRCPQCGQIVARIVPGRRAS